MKSIKAFLGGELSDQTVLCTALAAARPLAGHIESLHVQLSAAEAAVFTPHMEFATGAAIKNGLDTLEMDVAARSRGALGHYRLFLGQNRIEERERPAVATGISMSYREERQKKGADCIVREARYSDLAVMARAEDSNGFPDNLIEQVLMQSGRPLLLAPVRPPEQLTGTVLLLWKDTVNSARAMSAAMPLLCTSERVVIIGCEDSDSSPDGLQRLKQQLAWSGVEAETMWYPGREQSVSERLEQVALQYDADLLVMGAYSRSRTGEMLFGGCTRQILRHSAFPVLLMH